MLKRMEDIPFFDTVLWNFNNWETFLIYVFLNSFSEINFHISWKRRLLLSDYAYFIVTGDNSFPRAACNSPALERIFPKTKMTAKSIVFLASQQGSDI